MKKTSKNIALDVYGTEKALTSRHTPNGLGAGTAKPQSGKTSYGKRTAQKGK